MKEMNRRGFFKHAAEKTLPIMTMALLASLNINPVHAANDCSENCVGSCRGDCYGDCRGYCKGECQGSCKGSCQGSSAVCSF